MNTVSPSESNHGQTRTRPSMERVHHTGSHAGRYGVWLVLVALGASVSCVYAGGRKTPDLHDAPKKVDTEEMHINVGVSTVFCLAAGPAEGHPILLMHGARFSSDTWLQTNTIQSLVGAGYRVFAIDIPGFGKSPRATLYAKSFVTELLGKLTKKAAIIVTPSLSGRFAYTPLFESSPQIAGWVAVAPAAIDMNEDQLDKIKTPTLVVWGEKDHVFPLAQADLLIKKIAGAKKVVLEGAQHPCYLDQPEQFNKELIDFAASIFQKKGAKRQ